MSEPSAKRQQRRKDARPGEILAAALECFARHGYAATRLDDVAARVGVTKGTIYLYFPGKEALFKAVVQQMLVPLIERLEAEANVDTPVRPLLERLVTFLAGTVTRTQLGAIPKLVIAEAGNFPELAQFYLHEVVQRGRRLIRSVLQRGVERGEIRPVDVRHTAYCIMAPVLFALLWQHSFGPHDDEPFDPEALCRTHLELILRALEVEATPPETGERKGS